MADHAGATAHPVRANGAVPILDNDAAVLAWWDGAQALLGYRADDVVGRSVDMLLTTRTGGNVGRVSAPPAEARLARGTGDPEQRPVTALRDAFRTKPSPDDVTLLVARTRS
ncbi:hypothetical protein GA0115240_11679 [Streptomyces sp. DvalAA-14]|uniref:hypothetical protein n=1 Tax=unclassified Streptomyces TaxID=2593676 RepID=UPI00081B8A48|nr:MULTISPECIES: hypothetical protein [unclassified Streptomyces]SCD61368.1 hypothetical protein GA0115240_11679 [Streptomyces sp. DvalAA-14]